jgi:hypothetical protein
MNGFRKNFASFLSHYATFFAKMAERKVVPFDEFYYQLKLMHLFLLHPVFTFIVCYFIFIYNSFPPISITFISTYSVTYVLFYVFCINIFLLVLFLSPFRC